MDRPEHELRRTAYHEAGHVVMAWYAGRQLDRVTIESDEDQGAAGAAGYREEASAEPGQLRFWARWLTMDEFFIEEIDGTRRTPTVGELAVIPKHVRLAERLGELRWPLDALIVLAAGEAADRIVAPHVADAVRGSGNDRRQALDVAQAPPWETSVTQAVEFLQEPLVWRCVAAVATALLERHTLTGAELLDLLHETVLAS